MYNTRKKLSTSVSSDWYNNLRFIGQGTYYFYFTLEEAVKMIANGMTPIYSNQPVFADPTFEYTAKNWTVASNPTHATTLSGSINQMSGSNSRIWIYGYQQYNFNQIDGTYDNIVISNNVVDQTVYSTITEGFENSSGTLGTATGSLIRSYARYNNEVEFNLLSDRYETLRIFDFDISRNPRNDIGELYSTFFPEFGPYNFSSADLKMFPEKFDAPHNDLSVNDFDNSEKQASGTFSSVDIYIDSSIQGLISLPSNRNIFITNHYAYAEGISYPGNMTGTYAGT